MADAAVSVVAALALRGDRLLVERRAAADPDSPGAVRFSAGHVEPGETREEALRREVREELGRRVRYCRKVREADFTGADGVGRRLHYFLGSLSGPPP